MSHDNEFESIKSDLKKLGETTRQMLKYMDLSPIEWLGLKYPDISDEIQLEKTQNSSPNLWKEIKWDYFMNRSFFSFTEITDKIEFLLDRAKRENYYITRLREELLYKGIYPFFRFHPIIREVNIKEVDSFTNVIAKAWKEREKEGKLDKVVWMSFMFNSIRDFINETLNYLIHREQSFTIIETENKKEEILFENPLGWTIDELKKIHEKTKQKKIFECNFEQFLRGDFHPTKEASKYDIVSWAALFWGAGKKSKYCKYASDRFYTTIKANNRRKEISPRVKNIFPAR